MTPDPDPKHNEMWDAIRELQDTRSTLVKEFESRVSRLETYMKIIGGLTSAGFGASITLILFLVRR